jgi:peptidoglycan/LPS O-acetylase OafA/YrhL
MTGKRYETLDALRGVAAASVVCVHAHFFKLTPELAPHANLAVDFFFMLSGFVVAHAYGEALLGRMSWTDFAVRRLARLAPLAIAGALLGLVVLLGKWSLAPAREDPLWNILASGLLNLMMLPTLFSGAPYAHQLFPGDTPLWSLFFEIAINLIWAWIGLRLSTRRLALVVVACAILLAALAINHGAVDVGSDAMTFWIGAARSAFGFGLGVLICRLRHRLAAPRMAWGPVLLGAVLVATFSIPLAFAHGKAVDLVWDLACIFVVLPVLVVIGFHQGGAGKIGKLFGDLSYPVYVLQWPVLALLGAMHQRLFHQTHSSWLGIVAFPAILIFSWVALKSYDEPVRLALRRREVSLRHGAAPAMINPTRAS